jgi:hypothetical protein
MKKTIKLRTKIEAVSLVLLLIALSFTVVYGNRIISDTSDTVDTYIKNSNGKYWTATADNLQLAIYDLNSTGGGWVQVPYNFTIGTPVNNYGVYIYDIGNFILPIIEPKNTARNGSIWFNATTGEIGVYTGIIPGFKWFNNTKDASSSRIDGWEASWNTTDTARINSWESSWNGTSNIFNQDLNTSNNVIFNRVTSTFSGDGGNLTNISGSSNVFDQDLNSTDNVVFNSVNITGRNITSSSDTVDTYIKNSNGKYWTATADNLQLAIYDLNSTGGTVILPVCNITITTSILLTTDIYLIGQGNNTILYLDNSVNKSVIKNTSDVMPYNIHIRDLVIDGNQYNQPAYIPTSGDTLAQVVHGIEFYHLYNSKIEDVIFKNIPGSGFVVIDSGENITIRDCYFNRIGKIYEGEGDGLDMFLPCGVFFDGCNNTVVSGCYFNDIHSDCIVVEGVSTGVYADKATISDCIMNDAYCGIWLEYMRNVEVVNCIATNMNKIEAYDSIQRPSGFLASNCQNISFVNCLASYCGNTVGLNGSSFIGTGNGIIFNGCKSLNTYGSGIQTSAVNSTIIGCFSRNDSKNGVYAGTDAGNLKVISNTITKSGTAGIFLNPSGRVGNIISNNVIEDAFTYGIWTTGSHSTICSNSIYRSGINGILLDGLTDIAVIGNNIYETVNSGSDGIYLNTVWGAVAPSNITITGNTIYDPIDDGIVLYGNSINCTISSNNIKLADVGINEIAGSDWNIIALNNCLGCTKPIIIVGANTVNSTNLGAITSS